MHKPYLIQRAKIRTPLAESDARLSKAVGFDYMGSAEFEFGALPQSIKRIGANFNQWQCRLVNEIKEKEKTLRVYCALDDEEFEQYKEYLLQLRYPKQYGDLYTKESVNFEADWKFYSDFSRVDFWWDIKNDVMFSFKKEFMNRLPSYVKNQYDYYNKEL
jgi:hypothetical protein